MRTGDIGSVLKRRSHNGWRRDGGEKRLRPCLNPMLSKRTKEFCVRCGAEYYEPFITKYKKGWYCKPCLAEEQDERKNKNTDKTFRKEYKDLFVRPGSTAAEVMAGDAEQAAETV